MLKTLLEEHGQEHLLRFYEELPEEEKREFERQIGAVDWQILDLMRHPEDLSGRGRIAPTPFLTVSEIRRDRERYLEAGREAIRLGKVAAVLLAGGQGTRLGSDAPKGAFDLGVTRPLYIFELLIRNLLDVVRDCGVYVPLLIMTSEKNDIATREFFARHGNFGYPQEYLRFFRQDMAPSVSFEGKLFLEEKGRLALSPNGNGGWYASLLRADILKDFPAVEWFNVFSVDNVLQRIADPVFVGATILSGRNCGAKGVRKAYPGEKVGVLCLEDGLPSVIEYYEMSAENRDLVGADGEPVYSFGVTLNYLFRAEKLKEISGRRIPVHVVRKKIPYLNGAGERVVPERENGYKFETLILDMVRLMESCLPFEIVREREFAPVKNRTGADSVETARELLIYNGVEL